MKQDMNEEEFLAFLRELYADPWEVAEPIPVAGGWYAVGV